MGEAEKESEAPGCAVSGSPGPCQTKHATPAHSGGAAFPSARTCLGCGSSPPPNPSSGAGSRAAFWGQTRGFSASLDPLALFQRGASPSRLTSSWILSQVGRGLQVANRSWMCFFFITFSCFFFYAFFVLPPAATAPSVTQSSRVNRRAPPPVVRRPANELPSASLPHPGIFGTTAPAFPLRALLPSWSGTPRLYQEQVGAVTGGRSGSPGAFLPLNISSSLASLPRQIFFPAAFTTFSRSSSSSTGPSGFDAAAPRLLYLDVGPVGSPTPSPLGCGGQSRNGDPPVGPCPRSPVTEGCGSSSGQTVRPLLAPLAGSRTRRLAPFLEKNRRAASQLLLGRRRRPSARGWGGKM